MPLFFFSRDPFGAGFLGFCVNKKRTIGVVYNAISGEMFSAIIGRGAYCNGRKLQTSKETGSIFLRIHDSCFDLGSTVFLPCVKQNFTSSMISVN